MQNSNPTPTDDIQFKGFFCILDIVLRDSMYFFPFKVDFSVKKKKIPWVQSKKIRQLNSRHANKWLLFYFTPYEFFTPALAWGLLEVHVV